MLRVIVCIALLLVSGCVVSPEGSQDLRDSEPSTTTESPCLYPDPDWGEAVVHGRTTSNSTGAPVAAGSNITSNEGPQTGGMHSGGGCYWISFPTYYFEEADEIRLRVTALGFKSYESDLKPRWREFKLEVGDDGRRGHLRQEVKMDPLPQ